MLFLLLCLPFTNALPTLEVHPEDSSSEKHPRIEAGMLPDVTEIKALPADVIEKLKEKCKGGECMVQNKDAIAMKKFLRDQLIAQQTVQHGTVDVAGIDRRFEKLLQLKQEILNKQGIGEFIAASDDGLYEGDPILSEGQIDEMLKKMNPKPANEKVGVALFLDNPDLEKHKWNVRETIYWKVDSLVYLIYADDIHLVFQQIQDKVPCLQFKYTNEDGLKQPYMRILSMGSKLSPYYNQCGMVHFGRQADKGPTDIYFGMQDYCSPLQGNLLHLVLHALGVLHMHQRTDRNKFITVFEDRFQHGADVDFAIANDTKQYSTYGTKYDMKSVMHARVLEGQYYGFFSSSAPIQLFQIKDPKVNSTAVGNYDRLSEQDILLLKEMYCPNPKCSNEIDHKTCQTLYKRGKCNVQLMKKLCRRACNLC